MRQNKAGAFFMILGAGLIAAALSLFLYNQKEAEQASRQAEQIVETLKEKTEEAEDSWPEQDGQAEAEPEEIGGERYIGYLTLPVLELELPVMEDWSYPDLKSSPCRYYGAAATEDLVIAAHNYSRHFGQIKNLAVGDPVYFTETDGTVWMYSVAQVTILPPTAVEEMTSGDYALTLFTCTYGGSSRVAVRCERTGD